MFPILLALLPLLEPAIACEIFFLKIVDYYLKIIMHVLKL